MAIWHHYFATTIEINGKEDKRFRFITNDYNAACLASYEIYLPKGIHEVKVMYSSNRAISRV